MVFCQGEIVSFDFSPSLGSEPARRRPALVVSSNEFNTQTSMTLVCPITSTNNGFPLHLCLPKGLDTQGYVVVEQVRAFDLDARKAAHIEYIGEDSQFMANVKTLIKSFI